MGINGHDEEVQEFRLERFRVQHFRSFHDAELVVEPDITVLVGLNDVGKTSLLDAIEYYGLIGEAGFRLIKPGAESPEEDEFPEFTATWRHYATGQEYVHTVAWDPGSPRETLQWGDHHCTWEARDRRLTADGVSHDAPGLERMASMGSISRTQWRAETDVPDEISRHIVMAARFTTPPPYQLQPFGLGLSMPLDRDEMVPNGAGWVVGLQEIINRRDGSIETLEEHARGLFPHFRRAAVTEDRWVVSMERAWVGPTEGPGDASTATPDEDDVLHQIAKNRSARLVKVDVACPVREGAPPHSRWVPASQVSSGLLLYLAHLTLAMSAPQRGLVAIEEPENGLNGRVVLAMMHQFLGVVRERNLQLIMTTHDPLWLDLVEPRCIRVVTRDDSGSHIHADPDNLQRIKDEDYYLSEIMGLGGPEELLRKRGEAS